MERIRGALAMYRPGLSLGPALPTSRALDVEYAASFTDRDMIRAGLGEGLLSDVLGGGALSLRGAGCHS